MYAIRSYYGSFPRNVSDRNAETPLAEIDEIVVIAADLEYGGAVRGDVKTVYLGILLRQKTHLHVVV